MKKYIANSIKSVIVLLILTTLCTYIYKWNHLDTVFGPKISFDKWLAIIVILQMIFPTSDLFRSENKKDDEQGS